MRALFLLLHAVIVVWAVVSAQFLYWLSQRYKGTHPIAYRWRWILDNLGRRVVHPLPRTVDSFRVDGAHTVLEVGPGVGYFSGEVARRVGPEGRVVCVDIQPEMSSSASAARGCYERLADGGGCSRLASG